MAERDAILALEDEDIEELSRDETLEHLTALGAEFDKKDATERLKSKLRKAVSAAKTGATPKFKLDGASGVDPGVLAIIQVLQQQQAEQMKQQREQQQEFIATLMAERTAGAGNNGDGGAAGGRANIQNQGDGARGNNIKMTVRNPEKLQDDATYKTFKRWSESWNNWATLNKLSDKPRAEQLSTFRTHLSDAFLTRLTYVIGVPTDTPLTLPEVIEKITKYFKDQTNVVVARRDLLAKRQGANQKFDDFLVDFLEKADDAEINTMTPDDWRTTLIVCAMRDRKTRAEILSKRPALDYEGTKNYIRMKEGGESSSESMSLPGEASVRFADAALAAADTAGMDEIVIHNEVDRKAANVHRAENDSHASSVGVISCMTRNGHARRSGKNARIAANPDTLPRR